MVKYNKSDGVFTKIVGTDRKKSSYDVFLENGKKYLKDHQQLQEFTGIYAQLISMNNDSFELLSKLEELILQYRHLEDFKSNEQLKFSVGGRDNAYVYCYTKFYRHGHIREDIKEILGKTDVYGADHHNFIGNPELVSRARTLLERKMDETIRITEQEFNKLLEKKFGNINNIK